MKFMKILCTALLTGLSLFAAAADLAFDLQISRGAPKDYNPEIKKQTIAIFVIDCSGSMMHHKYVDQETGKDYRGPSGRENPWLRVDLVCRKMLPERFEALPAGTQVFAYLYGVTPKNYRGGWLTEKHQTLDSREKKAAFLQELQQAVYGRVKENGATPYYDAMEQVLRAIQAAGLLNNPRVNLELYDYTDGANATNGFDAGFFYTSHVKSPSYQNDLDRLAKRFNGKWGSFLTRIAQKGFYEKLNVGTKQENPGVKHIPAFKVNFACDKPALKSPKEAASQKVPLYASFPVNQECWDLLQKAQCTVKIQFGNGPVQACPVSLGQASCPVKVAVPAEAMDKKTKVTVSLDCPKGVEGKFSLAAPAPVSFYLPAPAARPSVEQDEVMVQGMPLDVKTPMTVLKGEEVFFTAESTAKIVWEFPDRKIKGASISRTFDKVGTYTFAVFAEGNEAKKVKGAIEVVDIGGIKIRNQGDTYTTPDQWQSFAATVEKGKLVPSSCDWYVVGPIPKIKPGDDEPKESLPVTQLDKQADPLQSRHFFRKPGEYKIVVTAKYDKLPRRPIDAATTWEVSVPAAIAFAKVMEPDGHGFEFAEEVKLAIEVTAGKVDEKSIVWKADGKEIGRGKGPITAPPVRGQGKIKVEYSVEVKDKVSQKTLSRKITYFFGCKHPEPTVEAVGPNGRKDYGIKDTVTFKVLPAGWYKEIVWRFSDGQEMQATNGQDLSRLAPPGGKGDHTMKCKCIKCGAVFSKTMANETQVKAPEPRLALQPAKTSFLRGDKVVLKDVGEGDYFKCRLLKQDPKTGEFAVDRDNLTRNFGIDDISLGEANLLDLSREDLVFKLQALDEKGDPILKNGKPVESAACIIRIRPYWGITAAILGIVVAFFICLICLMKRFLFGNQPCGWRLYYMARNSLVQNNPKEKEKFASWLSGESSATVGDYWTVWTLQKEKKATIPAGDLFSGYVGDDEIVTIDSEGEISYSGGFRRVPNYTLPVDNPSRQRSLIFEQKNKNSKQKCYLYFLLDKTESDTHYEIWFYVLCFCSLTVVAVAVWWLLLS